MNTLEQYQTVVTRYTNRLDTLQNHHKIKWIDAVNALEHDEPLTPSQVDLVRSMLSDLKELADMRKAATSDTEYDAMTALAN